MLKDGLVSVRDLGSRNGTLLGSVRLREGEVPVGAVLSLGDSTISIQPRYFVREVQPSMNRFFGDLVGESLAMREVFAIFERVALSDVPVLIEGESGTGKELAARAIHNASGRARQEYRVFDCASVPAALAESELFGHKKGAFSGATETRQGAFAKADGGTLCLDEIGELPLDLQPKLLRALEAKEFRPVGDDSPRTVDVRLLASTNRDLHAEVQRGRFRADLYYRLNVVKVRVPPLRQRPEDIPFLVANMLGDTLDPASKVSGANLEHLMSYGWPGNVRELKNVLLRAVAMSGSTQVCFEALKLGLLDASSTPATIGVEFPGVASRLAFKEAKAQLLASFEHAYLTALLKRHSGVVQKAAAEAGLSPKHVYALMALHGLDLHRAK